MSDPDLAALVGEAFVYGYPLVADVGEIVRFTQVVMGSVPAAPFNQFSHARTLAGPKDTFVTINNDTLYSIAQFDLSAGALFMDMPDAAGRYYVLQFIDAWTNNFAYVGTRASGTNASTWLLTPSDWSGDIPTGVTQIPFPTRVASVLGRWACSGADDLPAVHALQDQLDLRPAGDVASPQGVPQPAAGVDDTLAFFEQLRTWMRRAEQRRCRTQHQSVSPGVRRGEVAGWVQWAEQTPRIKLACHKSARITPVVIAPRWSGPAPARPPDCREDAGPTNEERHDRLPLLHAERSLCAARRL